MGVTEVVLLVMITTFELGGIIPFAGIGSNIPPEVTDAFAAVIKG